MITIDNDFQNLIPPLTNEEFAQLESNILRDGIRDALITWHGILIDGHNRYRIAQKYGLTYRTVEKQFTDRNDAERWIILNQFGRRNLSAYDRSILALKLKPIIAEKAKENLKVGAEITNTGLQKSVKAVNTQKELAKVAGVSHDTIAKTGLTNWKRQSISPPKMVQGYTILKISIVQEQRKSSKVQVKNGIYTAITDL